MRVGIISDIHDNIPNLDKTLNYLSAQQIERLLCCGDIGSVETLNHLVANFKGHIWSVLGNADELHIDYQQVRNAYQHADIFEHVGRVKIDDHNVVLVHEPFRYENFLEQEGIDYIFYGHTHKPWMEKQSGKIILNPGNISNYRYAPSFAIWSLTPRSSRLEEDTESSDFELIQLNQL